MNRYLDSFSKGIHIPGVTRPVVRRAIKAVMGGSAPLPDSLLQGLNIKPPSLFKTLIQQIAQELAPRMGLPLSLVKKVLAQIIEGQKGKYAIKELPSKTIDKGTATMASANKMSKTQLTAELAETIGTSKKIAAQFVESLSAIAYREAKSAGEFTIPGIGKLIKQRRKGRQGRNPATGESIKIPAKTVIKFRVATAAKVAVAGKGSKSAEVSVRKKSRPRK
jgi:DNA-binding protein HU-beta